MGHTKLRWSSTSSLFLGRHLLLLPLLFHHLTVPYHELFAFLLRKPSGFSQLLEGRQAPLLGCQLFHTLGDNVHVFFSSHGTTTDSTHHFTASRAQKHLQSHVWKVPCPCEIDPGSILTIGGVNHTISRIDPGSNCCTSLISDELLFCTSTPLNSLVCHRFQSTLQRNLPSLRWSEF